MDTIRYPSSLGATAMSTTGSLNTAPPIDPKNPAVPKVKIPPSAATIQYPCPVEEAAIPVTGWFRRTPPSEP